MCMWFLKQALQAFIHLIRNYSKETLKYATAKASISMLGILYFQ